MENGALPKLRRMMLTLDETCYVLEVTPMTTEVKKEQSEQWRMRQWSALMGMQDAVASYLRSTLMLEGDNADRAYPEPGPKSYSRRDLLNARTSASIDLDVFTVRVADESIRALVPIFRKACRLEPSEGKNDEETSQSLDDVFLELNGRLGDALRKLEHETT